MSRLSAGLFQDLESHSGVEPSDGRGVRVSFSDLPEGDYTLTAPRLSERNVSDRVLRLPSVSSTRLRRRAIGTLGSREARRLLENTGGRAHDIGASYFGTTRIWDTVSAIFGNVPAFAIARIYQGETRTITIGSQLCQGLNESKRWRQFWPMNYSTPPHTSTDIDIGEHGEGCLEG